MTRGCHLGSAELRKLRPGALIALALLAIAMTGCARIDPDHARICRTALTVIAPANADVEIEEITSGRQPHSVRIAYRAIGGRGSGLRFLECRFGGSRFSTERLTLTGAETERGRFREAEIYMLNRFWLETPDATAAPLPASISELAGVPQVSRTVALVAQHLLSALPQIAMLMLLAPTYTLIYGLTGWINLAFGELVIIGGQAALLGVILGEMLRTGSTPAMLAAGAALALFAAAAHGAAVGRFILVPLRQISGPSVLVATIGAAIALSEYVRLAQADNARWITPTLNTPLTLMAGDGFAVTVTNGQIMSIITAGAASLALVLLLRRSRFGLTWRAMADDPKAAALLGVDPDRLLQHTMALASLLAGLAGFIMTMHYGGIGWSGGLGLGLKALIAAVAGGIGSIGGALIGALVIGVAEALWAAFMPIEHRDAMLYALLVLLLVLRPAGLIGDRGGVSRAMGRSAG